MRHVVWSDQARDDLFEVVDYIGQDNPPAAFRVAERLDATAMALADMPTGRPGRVSGTYEKVVVGLPYILAYALHRERDGREAIYLLRIIHAARDWKPEAWPE